MPITFFIKPAPGMKIRMPDNPAEFLPEQGAEVPVTSFWLRRIKDGSVVCPAEEKGA
jgi:hypothetical protein